MFKNNILKPPSWFRGSLLVLRAEGSAFDPWMGLTKDNIISMRHKGVEKRLIHLETDNLFSYGDMTGTL